MTEDLINKKDIYFPSYLGTNDNLITLLNRATQTLCNWFSDAEKLGPLPFDENFKCTMPEVEGRNEDSKMYGITWSSVIEAWNLQADPNYDMYKKYFNSLINTDLKNMNEVRSIKLTEKAS